MLLILFAGFITSAYAQEEEIASVEYDSVSGNYIIKYGLISNPITLIYEMPNKINPLVNASVEYIGDGIYQYRYKLFNGKDSLQKLQSFEIKYWRVPISSESPDKGWYSRSLATEPTWRWDDTKYQRYGIPPSASLSGFSLTAFGLPGIVNGYFQGYVEDIEFPEEPPEEIDEALRKIDLDFQKSYVSRKTLGPTAPPADFKPIPFVDYIISLKHESYKLGWIKNAGIEQSLDAKLDNAKKKIEQGNIEAAKNILNAFISEVEAQGCTTYEDCSSGKHISPEGYALLKYNVQYLISKL